MQAAFGPQRWWPARTRFEVIVGAILTQAVAWSNVTVAIGRLRQGGLLDPEAMRRTARSALERAIRPAGYHRRKARALRAFVGFLHRRHGGRLDRLFRSPTGELRPALLDLPGIGPETADAILLYAGRRPVFVIDAYTRRILFRHRVIGGAEPYETLRAGFEAALPADATLFNEAHALLVEVGKRHCRKRAPICGGCPLAPFLPPEGPRDAAIRVAGSRRRTVPPRSARAGD